MNTERLVTQTKMSRQKTQQQSQFHSPTCAHSPIRPKFNPLFNHFLSFPMRFSLYPLSVLCATREHYIKHHKPIITVIPLIFAHFSPSNQHKHTLTISIATWKKYSSLFPFLWKYARSIHLWWYLLAFCWKHLDAVNWLRWYVGISHFLRRPRPYAPKFNSNAKWKCSQSNGFMTAPTLRDRIENKKENSHSMCVRDRFNLFWGHKQWKPHGFSLLAHFEM